MTPSDFAVLRSDELRREIPNRIAASSWALGAVYVLAVIEIAWLLLTGQ